jgi:plastocyanin
MTRSVLLVAGVAALAAAPAVDGATRRPQKRTVTIADNFYGPAKLTLNRGSTVSWVWPEDTGDVHDVLLQKGPGGVRHFQSEPGSAGYVFKRTLKVPGTYRIICTFHEEEMRMTIVVRR